MRILASLAAILLLSSHLVRQEESGRVRDLINKLHSERVEEREEAAKSLIKIGGPAITELEKIETGLDPEVAARAKEILQSLKSMAAIEVLHQIEERVLRARSLRVKAKHEVSSTETFGGSDIKSSWDARSQTLLKDGNKLSWVYTLVNFRSTDGSVPAFMEGIFRSNGSRMSHQETDEQNAKSAPPRPPTEISTPDRLKDNLSILLVYFGSDLAFRTLAGSVQWAQDENKPNPLRDGDNIKMTFEVVKASDEPAEAAARKLTFDLRFPAKGTPLSAELNVELQFHVELWYDVKQHTPVKLKLKVTEKVNIEELVRSSEFTATDIFEEFSLNAEIPEEMFSLPKRKED